MIIESSTTPIIPQQWLKDYCLALFVFCLVFIDLVILGGYSLTEGLRDDLGVKRITNRENPTETIGVRSMLSIENTIYIV